jgi:hypothetical protein
MFRKGSVCFKTRVTRLTVPYLFSFQNPAATKTNPAAEMLVPGQGFLILATNQVWLATTVIRKIVSLALLWKPTALTAHPAATPLSAIPAQESVLRSVEERTSRAVTLPLLIATVVWPVILKWAFAFRAVALRNSTVMHFSMDIDVTVVSLRESAAARLQVDVM